MIIEFLYFDDCPSWISALQNLKNVINTDFPDEKVDLIRVHSIEDARHHNFQGSPSIRIDGRDLEGKDSGYSFNCRLYMEQGKLSGVPSEALIRERIRYLISTAK